MIYNLIVTMVGNQHLNGDYIFFPKTSPCSISQAGLELMASLLTQPPEC